MNALDIVLLLVIFAAVALALRHMHKKRKTGGCGFGCEGCASRGMCGDKTSERI